ncbi:hypothetical protein EV401DRAFT_1897229 [Pisolithus croceorrhizus]|nr:hypothetical protein EV401DRAFT_1897229 [Pisolithus croceorrhizus]
MNFSVSCILHTFMGFPLSGGRWTCTAAIIKVRQRNPTCGPLKWLGTSDNLISHILWESSLASSECCCRSQGTLPLLSLLGHSW